MLKARCFWVFVITMLAFVNVSAYADDGGCDGRIVDSVGKHFHIQHFDSSPDDGVIVAAACKIWPYKDDLVIAVFAYRLPSDGKNSGDKANAEGEKELLIATVDKNTRDIVSSYQTTIMEDAMTQVGWGAFTIDTAGYQLSKDVRAFGIVFFSSAVGPSCADNSFYNELTLFVPEGKALRPIFRQFKNVQHALSGCIGSATGKDAWENAALSIAVTKTTSNGYADLKLTAAIEPGTNIEPPPADMKLKKRKENTLLHFDGNTYTQGADAPWWLLQ